MKIKVRKRTEVFTSHVVDVEFPIHSCLVEDHFETYIKRISKTETLRITDYYGQQPTEISVDLNDPLEADEYSLGLGSYAITKEHFDSMLMNVKASLEKFWQ